VKDLNAFMTDNTVRSDIDFEDTSLEDSVNKLKNCCLYMDGGVVEEKELMDTVEEWIGLETSEEVLTLQMEEVKEEMNIAYLCHLRQPNEGTITEANEPEDPELEDWLVQKKSSVQKPAAYDGFVTELDLPTALRLASSIKSTARKVFEEGNSVGGLAV